MSEELAPVRYSKQTKNYHQGRADYIDEQVKDVLTNRLGLKPDAVVLEVGAGTGKLSQAAAPYVGKLICVDHDEGQLEDLHTNMAHFGDKVEARCATAYATGLPDASVDAIIMGDTAHWLEAKQATREFRRVLKPGGKVAVFVRYPDPQNQVVQDLHYGLEEHCDEYKKPTANKFADFGELLAKKKGDHLIDEDGRTESSIEVKEEYTKEKLLAYLISRSSTGEWAQKNQENNPVLDPLFAKHAKDGKLTFPRMFHVTTGSVRELERAPEYKDRSDGQWTGRA